MSSNKIQNMICRVCDEVHPPPGENDAGVPKTFPGFKVADRLRLKPEIFAGRYPNAPADQNTFVIVGALLDGNCRRTIHCTVKFDRTRSAHRYQITVLWTGCVGDIKQQRKIAVWAEDVSVEKGGQ